jgi:PAS domain S-box-containing protein
MGSIERVTIERVTAAAPAANGDQDDPASETIRERFRPFETAPTAMLLVDSRGAILLTNERLDRVFGYEAGELWGRPVEVLTPPDVRDRHAELRDAFFEYPVTRQMGAARDLYGVSKDGRRIPVEIGLTTFDVDDKRLVLAFVLDLTERKKQEEKFRLVVDAAPNGILMVNVHGRIALVNGQVCAMFGYTQQELIGGDAASRPLPPQAPGLSGQLYSSAGKPHDGRRPRVVRQAQGRF